MMDHTASKPASQPASPPAADGPRWQRPKNLSQRQAWTVTYGQIIFTLTPFFAQCCISHTSLGRHKRCATRQQYNPRFEVSSPLNPNDLGALLHSFSLLGVLISTFFDCFLCTVWLSDGSFFSNIKISHDLKEVYLFQFETKYWAKDINKYLNFNYNFFLKTTIVIIEHKWSLIS